MMYFIDTLICLVFMYSIYANKYKRTIFNFIFFSVVLSSLLFFFKKDIFEIDISVIVILMISILILSKFSFADFFEKLYILLLCSISGNLLGQITAYLFFSLQTEYTTIFSYLTSNQIVIIYLTSRVMTLFFLALFSLFIRKYKSNLSYLELIPLVLSTLFIAGICYLFSKMLFGQWLLTNEILIAEIFVLVVTIGYNGILFYMLNYKRKLELSELSKSMILSQIDNYKAIQDLNEETLRIKHDMKHTLKYIEHSIFANHLSEAVEVIQNQTKKIDSNKTILISKCTLCDMIINDYKIIALKSNKDFKISMNISSDITLDKIQFNSILRNCLDNAFEYSGDNGWIEFKSVITNENIAIEIINSISDTPSHSKNRFRGKGLKNIATHVNECGGQFQITLSTIATCNITLPNTVPSNS